jgi:hypothetical protein
MNAARHLLTVWNPSYAADPLDLHLRILLDWAARFDRGECDEEDVYVWWAKLRSSNRDASQLPHHDEILAIDGQIEGGVETHLYLTDYRSLYAAEVDRVTDEDVMSDDEADHMPSYYATNRVDLWFQVTDLRRVVYNDTVAVIDALKKLNNVRYHERPVSLYGGMVELPLIVTRPDGKRWFPRERALTEGRLWAQHDAEVRGETDEMARELRDNLLGPAVWAALDPATRTFLASADTVFRQRRADTSFDFSGPVVGYAKALECELNALLFPPLRTLLRKAAFPQRTVRHDGRSLDLGDEMPHQTIGAVVTLLEQSEPLQKAVRTAFAQDWKWVLGEMPHQLRPICEVRNPAAHSEHLPLEKASELRQQILGIGREGLLVQIARVRMRVAT